jgi:hypothetical protein
LAAQAELRRLLDDRRRDEDARPRRLRRLIGLRRRRLALP